MLQFFNIDGKPFLKMYDFVKNYDDVVRTVYYKTRSEESPTLDGKCLDAEEKDFLIMRDYINALINTSKDVNPKIFRPLLNAKLKILVERSKPNFKVSARLYDETYINYESINWLMNKNGLEAVVAGITDIFPTKSTGKKV